MRDVSERMKFERELQETQKMESLGLLAGGIAHDFNNLVTGILGNACLALSDMAPDQPMRLRLREIGCPIVPQDVPDAPQEYPDVSLAIDFDTDHGYKKPPAWRLWQLQRLHRRVCRLPVRSADPVRFCGGFKVLITGPDGLVRSVLFSLDEEPGVITAHVRAALEDL